MNVTPAAANAAIEQVEQMVSEGEAAGRRVRESNPDAAIVRALHLMYGARQAVELLALIGVLPYDHEQALLTRLAEAGLHTSTGTATGQSSAGVTTVAHGPRHLTGGPQPAGGLPGQLHPRADRRRRRLFPPRDEIPGVVAVNRVLGHSDTVAVVLVELHAYSTGVQFDVEMHGRGERPPFIPDDPEMAARLGVPVATPPELVVELDDGNTVAAAGTRELLDQLESVGDGHTLHAAGGGGNNERLGRQYFLTPYPGSGLTIRFSWPSHGLPVTHTRIDQQQLLEARRAATPAWTQPADPQP